MTTTRDAAIENQALRDFWKTWQVGLPNHLHGRPTSAELWRHAWQAATQIATLAERERCAMRAAQLAEDAAIIYANGFGVNFNQAVGNPIRSGE